MLNSKDAFKIHLRLSFSSAISRTDGINHFWLFLQHTRVSAECVDGLYLFDIHQFDENEQCQATERKNRIHWKKSAAELQNSATEKQQLSLYWSLPISFTFHLTTIKHAHTNISTFHLSCTAADLKPAAISVPELWELSGSFVIHSAEWLKGEPCTTSFCSWSNISQPFPFATIVTDQLITRLCPAKGHQDFCVNHRTEKVYFL